MCTPSNHIHTRARAHAIHASAIPATSTAVSAGEHRLAIDSNCS